MYIFELIFKLLKRKEEKETKFDKIYDMEKPEDPTEYEQCEHVFMPIDSTNEILSCAKCGILKKRSELEVQNVNKNPFFKS